MHVCVGTCCGLCAVSLLMQWLCAVKGFVEGTTTYGTTGTKDQDLRFRSEVLGGTFVFVRYHSVKTPR